MQTIAILLTLVAIGVILLALANLIRPFLRHFPNRRSTGKLLGGGAVLFVVAMTLGVGAVPSAPTTAKSPPITFRQIGAADYDAMVYPATMSHAQVENAVREHCAGKQWCKVLGWTDPAAAASALPMTDREVDAEKLDYILNRTTGADEFTWMDQPRKKNGA